MVNFEVISSLEVIVSSGLWFTPWNGIISTQYLYLCKSDDVLKYFCWFALPWTINYHSKFGRRICKHATFHLMPEVEVFGGGYQSSPDLSNFIPEMFHQHLQQCFSTQCMVAFCSTDFLMSEIVLSPFNLTAQTMTILSNPQGRMAIWKELFLSLFEERNLLNCISKLKWQRFQHA